jgi:hypothetical protein
MAVIPAVKRSLYPPRTTPKQDAGAD